MNFKSKNLQQAFDEAKPVLEQINQTKNTISTEIKAIEKYFQELGVVDNFAYCIKDPYLPTSLHDSDINEHTLDGWAITQQELLLWDKEKARLIYQLNHYEADADLYASAIPIKVKRDTRREIVNKPLIEAKFEIRKRVYEEHLSEFIKMITAHYTVKPKNTSNSPEVPF